MITFFIYLSGEHMKYFNLLLKGILIGIGKIIPGVSGAMIAISLNVYEKGINSISTFFKNIKENLKILIPLGIGILVGIVTFSKIIINLLNSYYLPTMLFFVGLIIGGIRGIKKDINMKKKINVLIIILIIIFSIILSKIENISYNKYDFVTILIMGIIEALTMIIPGISGTAILMCLGYYNLIIESFSNFNIIVLFPFGIGLIIGVITITKIINFLFNNYKEKTYVVIYGFSLSSILFMFLMTFKNNYALSEIIISLGLMILGYNITKTIEK